MLCRHLWGVEEPRSSFFPKLKAKGYEAVDAALWDEANDAELAEQLAKNGLKLVCMIHSGGDGVREHLKVYEEVHRRAKALKPLRIYAHAGKDNFSESEQDEFFSQALALDPSVCFETHRGRVLYNPWTTERLMSKFKQLRLNADFSHWAVVSESLMEGRREQAILREAAGRCDHIHARVGYEQGPQVPDPRSPLWEAAREAHERWWDMVWDSQELRGLEISTLTPEFGPPAYQSVNPLTGKPDCDLAEICDWQAARQAKRFKERT